ncbi:MAG: hypothetical protein RLZZ459_178 [Cyanobacteriota bacterium]|jgi:hypothetical protein
MVNRAFGCGALLAAAALLLGPWRPLAAAEEAFGRWRYRPNSCVVEHGAAPQLRCQELQLDQRSSDVLRLSVQADAKEPGTSIRLTLVGALAEGSEPMGCRNGSCSLKRPLSFNLVSLSLARFDGRGLVQSLPRTWSVRGDCQIDSSDLRCEALNSDLAALGEPPWIIQAQLR